MIYYLKDEGDVLKATQHLKNLIEKEAKIEILEKRRARSIKQNSYFHLLLNHFALEYGETLGYVKQEIFKKQVNPDIFKRMRANRKTLQIREDWRSSADLDSKEMTEAIDRFKNWSAKEFGLRLPEADEEQFLDSIKNEIEKNKQYL